MTSLMGKWSKVPDLEGSGPFPASYAMAPNGLEMWCTSQRTWPMPKPKASWEFMSGAMADVLQTAPVRVST